MLRGRRREARVTGALVIRSLIELRGRPGDTAALLLRLWGESVPPSGNEGPLEMEVVPNQTRHHRIEWGVLHFYGTADGDEGGRDVLAWWFKLGEAIDHERRDLMRILSGTLSVRTPGSPAIRADHLEATMGGEVSGDE